MKISNTSKNLMPSTLLYHTGALGDFITTIPAMRLYRKQHPDTRITLLGRPAIGVFAHDAGIINEWRDIDDPNYLPLFHDDFSEDASAILAPFSAAILFTAAESLLVKNIRQSSIEKLFRQPPFPASPMHVVDYHLSLFGDPDKMDTRDKMPCFVPSEESLATAEGMVRTDPPPVAIHPGSGSQKKNWPFDRFLAVADFFRSKQIPVLWIQGPADEVFSLPAVDRVVSSPPLATLAAILSCCRAFIGNDSGVTHLAAATGCPTVAIFGPSDPRVWAPRGERVYVLYNDISVIKVLDVFSSYGYW